MSASAPTRRSPAHQGRRSRAPRRRPHERDAVLRPIRCSTFPMPRQTLVHVHPGAEELGRVYRPTLAINASRHRLRRGARRHAAAERDPRGARRRARRTRTISPGPTPPSKSPARCQYGDDHGTGCATGCPRTRSSPTAPATTRLGAPLPSASAASAPSSRRPRARWATACRRRSPPSCSIPERTVVVLCRRRLLPDERPGIRDRRAVRRCRSSSSSSTTASTARSACTRSANIPAASSRTELKNPDFAAYARAYGGHGETGRDDRRVRAGLRARRRLAASPRSSTSSSIPRRSPPRPPSRRSARRRWPRSTDLKAR